MITRNKALALAGTAAGVAAGVAAERLAVRRRRRNDAEASQDFAPPRGTRTRTIELSDGARIFVEEVGPPSGPGVVFIHGSALRTDAWHYQRNALEGRRLVFYDLRGHGRSRPKGDADFSVMTLADDLAAVIDVLALDEAVLVGHSIGGMIGLDLCRSRRDLLGTKIKGMVLVNTTYRPPIETIAGGAAVARLERATRRPFDFIGTQSTRIDRLRKLVKPSDALFWAVSFAAFGPGASARQVDFTYDMLAETPADVIFDLFKAYRGFDATDHLGEVTIPVLVIGGTHDRITLAKASEYLAQHLPKAELKLLDCGHMAMLERHSEFNAELERFLDDTLDRVHPTSTKSSRTKEA